MDKKPLEDYTTAFKEQIKEAADLQEALAALSDFWKEHIPGGPRKRKRFRTPGHGKRKGIRRRRNKAASAMRKKQRPPKKRRS